MAKMRALVTQQDHKVAVQQVDVPTPTEGEILVKVDYVAQNPTDWKAAAVAPPGRIVGCDFAGTVADANGSTTWREGQRVAGFVQGTSANGVGPVPLRGVFAEFCVVDASLVYAVPDEVADPQACVVPLAFATAVQALFQRLGLPEPSAGGTAPPASGVPLLVNGATTSVGMYAVQLGRLAGLRVVATGSGRNHGLLKALGAAETVDYSDNDWPEQVRRLTQDGLGHALDCIAEKGTWEAVARAMSPAEGGHIVGLLPAGKVRPRVEEINSKVRAESTIAYTVFGRPLKYPGFDNCGEDKATPEDRAVWEKYLGLLPELLRGGKIEPNRVREFGGLEDISRGFEEQKAARVSAEKLVYKIAASSAS